jgi:hypothetical protein
MLLCTARGLARGAGEGLRLGPPAEIGVTALRRTALTAWQEQPAAIWVVVGDAMDRCSCGWVGRWSTPRLGLVSAGP